jgi:hypothetical protein
LAEVFSIGLTVLSAGTLEHCNDVYLRDPLKINTQRLASLLDQFAKRYSQYLTLTLKSMLELSPVKRVRSKQLYETLSKYEQQILDLEEFQTSPAGYNQYNQFAAGGSNGYPNQVFQQQYAGGLGYGQAAGYSYPVGNPQYAQQQNVRWNNDAQWHEKRM